LSQAALTFFICSLAAVILVDSVMLMFLSERL
jgi:hypothetical protein